MQVVRSIKTGFNGPKLGVSHGGKYLMAGSYAPHIGGAAVEADRPAPL